MRMRRRRFGKKRFTRSTRKRSFGNRTGKIPSARGYVQFRKGPTPAVPPRVRVVLPYTTTVVLGDGLVGSAYAVFRMNGPLDPEYALGGGSAVGYAELAAAYSRAIVHKSWAKVEITIRDTAPATGGGAHATNIIAGVHKTVFNPDTSVTAFDTLDELRIRCNQRLRGERFIWRRLSRVVSGYNAAIARGGRNAPLKLRFGAISAGFPSSRPYGVLSDDAGGDPYGLTFDTTSFPNNENYFTCFAFRQESDGGFITPMPYTYFDISVWYDIEFFDPVFVGQS